MTEREERILALLRDHVGRPCPTNEGIAKALAMRKPYRDLRRMERAGRIAVEWHPENQRRRRIRLPDGAATDWAAPIVHKRCKAPRIDTERRSLAQLLGGRRYDWPAARLRAAMGAA